MRTEVRGSPSWFWLGKFNGPGSCTRILIGIGSAVADILCFFVLKKCVFEKFILNLS